jgi:hypothetical protein
MKLGELTQLYVDAKGKLEAERGPPKRQKAVEGISLGHELIRDTGLIAFMMGAIFFLIAVAGPPLHAGYDVTKPPTFVKPDWYLLWSLGPIFVAKWPIANPLPFGPDPLVDTKFLGTLLVNVAFVAVALVPFIAGRGKSMRPIESPMNFSMGIFGLAIIWWLSVVGIADIIFAYEVQPVYGRMHWMFEAGTIPSPSELIDMLGIVSLWQTLVPTFLAYWFIKRHRPRYESKLNATYYKVR